MLNKEILRRRRIAYGMSQRDLADLCHISTATVSNLESGKQVQEVYSSAIEKTLNDYWNSLTCEGRHQAKLMELALQISESDDANDRYKMRTITYIIKEASMYLADLTREQS